MKLPKAIFFDWDGTLVDSYQLLLEAHNFARGQIGLEPFSVDGFRPYFGKPRDYLYQAIYGDDQDAARTHFEEFVTKNHIDHLKPLDGVVDLLKTIAELDIPAAIISNKKGRFIRQEIKHYGWDKYFKAVVGAGEATEDKPSAAPIIMAMAQSGLDFEYQDIWYVGDTDVDMQAAENAGTQAILMQDKDADHDIAARYAPLLVAENCAALQRFLLQCAEK